MRFASRALVIALFATAHAAVAAAPAAPTSSATPSRLPDLEVDASFAPQPLDHRGGEVRALAFLPDQRVLAGGTFMFAGNSECRFFACFTRDGTLDRTFLAVGACDGPVTAIRVLADGRVLVAGMFRTFAGRRTTGIVRLLATGALDPTFNPPELANGGVAAIALTQDGRIFIGGVNTRAGDADASFLARLMPDGALDASFRASEVEKGKRVVVASIAATRDGGAAAVLAVDDCLYEPLDPAVPPPAKFTREAGTAEVAKFLADGTVDPKFRAQRTAAIAPRCIAALQGGDLLVGGRGGVQRIGADGLIDGVFRFGEAGRMQVETLALLPGGRILAGGLPAPGALLPARLLVLGPDGAVESRLVAPRVEQQIFFASATDTGGNVVAGGQLAQAIARVEFSATTNRIIRLDRALNPDSTFRGAVGNAGRTTAVAIHPDGSLTIGGIFLSVGGESRPGLAHLKPDGAIDRSFDPGMGMNAAPRVLVPTADGGVVAAGLLDRFDGRSAKSVVRVRSNGTVDWDFAPDIPFRGLFTDSAILSDGTFILVGQLMGRTADALFSHAVRLDPAGKIDRVLATAVGSWLAPGAGSILTAAATDTGHVLFGGEFTVLQGQSRSALARVGGEGQVDPRFVPETTGFISVTKISVLPDRKIFVEGWRQAAGDKLARRAFTRLLPDGRRDPSFKEANFGTATPLMCAALIDGTVVVAVRDLAPDAIATRRLVRLDRDGALMPGFNIELGNARDTFQLLPTSDGTIYVFGNVPSIGGQPRHGLARLVPKR